MYNTLSHTGSLLELMSDPNMESMADCFCVEHIHIRIIHICGLNTCILFTGSLMVVMFDPNMDSMSACLLESDAATSTMAQAHILKSPLSVVSL